MLRLGRLEVHLVALETLDGVGLELGAVEGVHNSRYDDRRRTSRRPEINPTLAYGIYMGIEQYISEMGSSVEREDRCSYTDRHVSGLIEDWQIGGMTDRLFVLLAVSAKERGISTEGDVFEWIESLAERCGRRITIQAPPLDTDWGV